MRERPYQERPVRFSHALTDKGADLEEALGALVKWGKTHIPGTKTYAEIGMVESRTGRKAGSLSGRRRVSAAHRS